MRKVYQVEELRRRVSVSRREYYKDEGHRQEAAKYTRAAWARGVYSDSFDEECLRKRAEAIKAARQSEESRNKSAEATRAAWARGDMGDEEWRRKHSNLRKKLWQDEEWRDKQVRLIREGQQKEGYRDRIAAGVRKAHARGDYDGVFRRPSSIEIKVATALDEYGIVYVTEYRPSGNLYPYDFYIPLANLLIEVDGEFWHHSDWAEKQGHVKRDRRKDKIAADLGFRLLRIRERDLMEHGAQAIIAEQVAPLLLKEGGE